MSTKVIPPKELLEATIGGLSVLVVAGGADGDVLTKQSDGTYAPETPSAASGDVVGPASATDNAIARFDTTTGKLVQNTPQVTIADTGAMVIAVATASSSALTLKSTDNSAANSLIKICRANGTTAIEAGFLSSDPTLSAITFDGRGSVGHSNAGYDFSLEYIGYAYASMILKAGNAGEILGLGGTTATHPGVWTNQNITTTKMICVGVYTFATVPSASANSGKFLRISDRSQKHAYSDGTDWRFFGDDAIIS